MALLSSETSSFIKKIFFRAAIISSVSLLAIFSYLYVLTQDLPSLDVLQRFNPAQVSKIVSADGEVISELYKLNTSDVVSLSDIPKELRYALLSMEDREFFDHNGIRFESIFRALIVDLLSLSRRQGASTITQQLARNMYAEIGFEKTISRKIKEFITAINIEKTYTKSEIMELYFNSVYFGVGNQKGVQSAAKYYFGKDVNNLNVEESALLIGLLPAPGRYTPFRYPDRAIVRRNLVLRVMNQQGFLSDEKYQALIHGTPGGFSNIMIADSEASVRYLSDGYRTQDDNFINRAEYSDREADKNAFSLRRVDDGLWDVVCNIDIDRLDSYSFDINGIAIVRVEENYFPGIVINNRTRGISASGGYDLEDISVSGGDAICRIRTTSMLTPKKKSRLSNNAPYFTEYIRRELEKIDTELDVDIYEDGLIIHTTLDSRVQKVLNKSFNDVIERNQKKLNSEFLSDEEKLLEALDGTEFNPDSVREILRSGDLIPRELRKKFLVQGSVVALDPVHGNILGMIGGRQEAEYIDRYGFNRATQAKRQPGSIFKPFIYLSALENDTVSAATRLLNQPLIIFFDDTTRWNPQNHDRNTGGKTTLRDGLRRSLNLISVRAVQELTSPRKVADNAKKFNLTTYIDAVQAIALGVSDVIPIEIVSAYATIANNGIYNAPIGISRIEDKNGRVLKSFKTESFEVKEEPIMYILRDMMKSVVDAGTGYSIRRDYGFKGKMAGKTGTTNEKADAWFIGFTPQLCIGVWMGMDEPSVSLGKNQWGGTAALPVFGKSIKEIYDYGKYRYADSDIQLNPNLDWDAPDGVVTEYICKDTYKKATRFCTNKVKEILLKEYTMKSCEKHDSVFREF